MREVTVYVPPEAVESMGFDGRHEGFDGVDVVDVRVVSSRAADCIAVVTYSDPVDDALDDAEHVTWWERLDTDGPAASYLCETVAPDEASPDRGEALAVQTVAPDDRGFTVTLVGREEVFECEDGDVADVVGPLTLRRLRDYEGPPDDLDALTDRQREVLETAFDLGYYEVPRRTTADEVARTLDLDRSTVTEHLQRAERNLLSAVLSE